MLNPSQGRGSVSKLISTRGIKVHTDSCFQLKARLLFCGYHTYLMYGTTLSIPLETKRREHGAKTH